MVPGTFSLSFSLSFPSPLDAQRIQEDFVVAPQLDVLQPRAAGQDVEGDRKHVVRFVIGQMPLQHVHPLVDAFGQTDVLGQQLHRPHAANRDAAHSFGQLIGDAVAGEHGPLAMDKNVLAIKPPLDATLAIGQPTLDTLFRITG